MIAITSKTYIYACIESPRRTSPFRLTINTTVLRRVQSISRLVRIDLSKTLPIDQGSNGSSHLTIIIEPTGRGPRHHHKNLPAKTSGEKSYHPHHSDLLCREREVWTVQKNAPRLNIRQTRKQYLRCKLIQLRRKYHDSSSIERIWLTQL